VDSVKERTKAKLLKLLEAARLNSPDVKAVMESQIEASLLTDANTDIVVWFCDGPETIIRRDERGELVDVPDEELNAVRAAEGYAPINREPTPRLVPVEEDVVEEVDEVDRSPVMPGLSAERRVCSMCLGPTLREFREGWRCVGACDRGGRWRKELGPRA
jgi:hypothetical protein